MFVELDSDKNKQLTALELRNFLDNLPDDLLNRVAVQQDEVVFRKAILQQNSEIEDPTLFFEEY
ncbi:hypothetical protein ACFQH1_02280 [Lactiplantibacillus daoliensis]|uniref:EF-hand domain-containing protein n=1 Tax=Lactiplantibacillus daoliensis TaxID=2559916 RepID=A0ABW1UFL2_9LACO|nr:hypothetical protein [Lactiplantibacillus daoliensis]